jgi:UDPglucose--hexose-1-phosphate uridylyltransferase
MSQGGLVWEQRWHPLRGEWVLFTSHRSGRPWVGETVPADESGPPSDDPQRALCPRNRRMHEENPQYQGVYWFANDLPCFSAEAPEVVCYHPDHAKTFADLTTEEATRVVDVWTERYRELGARPEVDHVLIFENKGALVGASNPHPHCQIYASNLVYGHIAREGENARAYFERTGRSIGQEILRREAESSRVICENGSFLACVPWFARYAYEVFILPKRQASSLAELTADERHDLAALMREVAVRYDNLWQRRLPYIMVLHPAPTDGKDYSFFPFHIEYHPPLRKPDTMKYLAGPETGGGSMTNESNLDEKATELRAVSAVLYRQQT